MGTRKLLALLLAAAMAMSLAACSSDSSDDEASGSLEDESEISATQGDGDSSSDDGDSSSDDGDSSSDDGSSDDIPDLGSLDECFEASMAFASITLIPLGLSFGATDEDLEELQDSLEELDASIPEEVSEDFEVIKEAYQEFGEAMSEVDFTDPQALLDEDISQQMEDASALIETPEVEEATANIEAYFEENCA